MSSPTTAVALAVRAHPRGGAPSASDEVTARLRSAAADLVETSPELISGPSSVSPEGALLLKLSSPEAILGAILSIAGNMRPLPTTFSAAVRGASRRGHFGGALDEVMIAWEAAASAALAGARGTDPREHRVAVQLTAPDPLVSPLIELMLRIHDGMTERQKQIVALARACDTQQEAATHLGISRQAVNQSLTAAGWHQLRRAEEAIEARLSRESGTEAIPSSSVEA
jgi:DNA-binding NarL/FixJ family response regulator